VAPSPLLVDQGYTSAISLLEQAKHGTQIVGPLQESTSWQAQAGEGYGLYDFEVDWQQQSVRCPQGHLSQRWAPFTDRHGTEKIEVRFPAKTCQECVARAHCTTGAKGRILKLLPQASLSGVGEPPAGTPYCCIPASVCSACWYRRDDFTRSASDQDATESLSRGAQGASASCADCNWDQCAPHRHASSGPSSRQAFASSPSSHPLCSSQGGGSTVTFRCPDKISQQSHSCGG
jgi:hypothetical protein